MPHNALDGKWTRIYTTFMPHGEAILGDDMETRELRIRVPEDMKAWLVAKAEDQGRSINSQINQTLKAAMSAETQKETTK